TRPVGDQVAHEEMTGKRKALRDFLPGCAPSIADESGQREKLAGIELGLRGTDCPPRFGTDRYQRIVRAGHRASFEIEPKAELRQDKQLIADQRRAPPAHRRRSLDRVEQAFERLVKPRI